MGTLDLWLLIIMTEHPTVSYISSSFKTGQDSSEANDYNRPGTGVYPNTIICSYEDPDLEDRRHRGDHPFTINHCCLTTKFILIP